MSKNFPLIPPPRQKRANRLKSKPTGRSTDDPTPTEIEIRCAEIQAEWSPEDEYRHRVSRTGAYRINNPISTQAVPGRGGR